MNILKTTFFYLMKSIIPSRHFINTRPYSCVFNVRYRGYLSWYPFKTRFGFGNSAMCPIEMYGSNLSVFKQESSVVYNKNKNKEYLPRQH